MNGLLMVLAVCGIAAVIYLFLVSPKMFHKSDRSAFFGVHYAHRGLFDNKSNAPENSLNAIRKAVDAGYGIEFDVQLSKDQIPVVFHDAALKRMCGVNGKIWEYTLEELKKMRLADSQETIPTLSEVLKTVRGRVPLIVEYKMDKMDTKVCELGNELLKDYKGVYCIESFHPLAVGWYRKNRPDIVRGQLSEDFSKDGKHSIFLKVVTYLLSNFYTRPDFIAYCHVDADNFSRRVCRKLGALSVAWTIKSQEQYEKARSKFDLFIFDSFILKNPE